jgi:histone H3/H4
MARGKIVPKRNGVVAGAKAPVQGGIMPKKRRWRPGTVAMREIRKYQRNAEPLLPRLPFRRLLRDILLEIHPDRVNRVNRMTRTATDMLQEGAEQMLVQLFKDAQLLTVYAGRVGLGPGDLHMAQALTMMPANLRNAEVEERVFHDPSAGDLPPGVGAAVKKPTNGAGPPEHVAGLEDLGGDGDDDPDDHMD